MLAHWNEAEQQLLPVQRTLKLYFLEHPFIGKINLVAAWFVEILGPMFWAVLIVLFVWAELSAN